MIEVLNKTYELIFKVYDNRYTIKYNQMSMYDCIEFNHNLSKAEFDIYEWVYNFIIEGGSKITEEQFRLIDINKLLDAIFDTAMKGFYDKKQVKGKSYPYEAYIALLSKELNIDPNKLLRGYTPEQIKYYSEGVMYNFNEQSKEGQKRNTMEQAKKEMNKEHTAEQALAIAKEMEARLKSKTK